MAYKGIKLMVCPACGKRGVSVRFAHRGEDHYKCRYCQWWAFTGGSYADDVAGRAALDAVNPDRFTPWEDDQSAT